MELRRSKILKYIFAFLCGIAFSYFVSGIGSALDIVFLGSEVCSQASFPRMHIAHLYARPGLGDQALTLGVDGETVYVSNDAPGGNLQERLSWDSTGTTVSLELSGRKVFAYNARAKREVED